MNKTFKVIWEVELDAEYVEDMTKTIFFPMSYYDVVNIFSTARMKDGTPNRIRWIDENSVEIDPLPVYKEPEKTDGSWEDLLFGETGESEEDK